MSGPAQTPAFNGRAFSGYPRTCNLPNLLSSTDLTTWDQVGNISAPGVSGGQTGPTGASDAILLTATQNVDGTGGSFSIIRQLGITVTNSQTYTFSVYLKAGTGSVVVIYINDGVTTITPVVCNLSAGWQRFSATLTVASTSAVPTIGWFGAVYNVSGLSLFAAEPMLNSGLKACTFKAV